VVEVVLAVVEVVGVTGGLVEVVEVVGVTGGLVEVTVVVTGGGGTKVSLQNPLLLAIWLTVPLGWT
jgi:hypothetical protein